MRPHPTLRRINLAKNKLTRRRRYDNIHICKTKPEATRFCTCRRVRRPGSILGNTRVASRRSFFVVTYLSWRCFPISKDSLRINEEIHIREVRVTSATGEQLGIMATRDALQLAEEQHLDLVEVAPKAKPPVCRIMDFGKYRYEQQKRDKEAKKKQKVITIKEVKLRPNIEQHDFDVKLKNALRFIEEGNKVKVTIMFRGREMSHQELGRDVLRRVAEELKDLVAIERDAKLEGKNMIMILAPKVSAKAPKAKTKGGEE